MLNKEKLNNLAGELWKGAKKLRGKFKAYEYQAVILPMIMIRRIECMLIQKRTEIEGELKKANPKITEAELKKKVKQREILTIPYYNKSEWTLTKILKDDATQVEAHFREYLKEFSPILNEIIDEFNYRETISKMVKANRLESIIDLVDDEDFSTQRLSNIEMGYVYEELLQRFTQDDAKDTGEHFTPREIIRIMVELMQIDFNPKTAKQAISIYDPACGTGGMLSTAKEHLMDKAKTEAEQQNVQTLVQLVGQEYLGQNYAVCKTDLLLRGDLDGSNKDNITKGNSLIPDIASGKEPGDKHFGRHFDYLISNPPFGVDWDEYKDDIQKLKETRYRAGIPPSDNGAMMFLQTMIEKMKPASQGGSKISILFNGSPLSNGDCGGGESEIRRSILEADLLDSIVMLPDQMFYQTGIYTYVWILDNNKPKHKRGKIIIINARKQYEKEPKAFGNKRNRITESNRNWIIEQYNNYKQNDFCRIVANETFSYHKLKVVFWQTDENDKPMWITEPFSVQLNNSNVKKKFNLYGDFEMSVLIKIPNDNDYNVKFKFDGENTFETILRKELSKAKKELKEISAKEFSTWLKKNEISATYYHRHYLEDAEYVTFGQELETHINREFKNPIIKWEDSAQLGYEFIPTRFFYEPLMPVSSETLLSKFWQIEEKTEKILTQIKLY
jgi:type I restriction enzyme M protein